MANHHYPASHTPPYYGHPPSPAPVHQPMPFAASPHHSLTPPSQHVEHQDTALHSQHLVDNDSPPDSTTYQTYEEFRCAYRDLSHRARVQIILNALKSSKHAKELQDRKPRWQSLLKPASIIFLFDPQNPFFEEGSNAAHNTSLGTVRDAVHNISRENIHRDWMIDFTDAVIGDILPDDTKLEEMIRQ